MVPLASSDAVGRGGGTPFLRASSAALSRMSETETSSRALGPLSTEPSSTTIESPSTTRESDVERASRVEALGKDGVLGAGGTGAMPCRLASTTRDRYAA